METQSVYRIFKAKFPKAIQELALQTGHSKVSLVMLTLSLTSFHVVITQFPPSI